eukprot:scaffold24141_cov54-Skeletonema_dohrnii-CCMP3373.AAC.1
MGGHHSEHKLREGWRKFNATFKYLSISKSSFRFTPDFIVHVFVGPSPLDGGLLLPVFRVWEEGGLLN